MPITPAEVAALLRQGENEQVDFKLSVRNPQALARGIAALANTQGGILLIGVDDRRSVVGADVPQVERLFHSALRILVPQPEVHLQVIDLGRPQQLVAIQVQKSPKSYCRAEACSAV